MMMPLRRFCRFSLAVLASVTFVLGSPAAALARHEGKLQILLVGDSTTEGSVPRRLRPQGPHLEETLRLLLAAQPDLPPANVVNLGQSGDFIRRFLDAGRYDKEAAKQPGVDYIFVRFGINDQARREGFASNFPKDYHELIGRLRRDHPQAVLVITTIIPYLDEAGSSKVNGLIRRVAQEAKLPLFDLYPRYAAELKKGPNMLNYRRYELKNVPVELQGLAKPFLFGNPPKVEVMDNQLDAHFGHLPGWYSDRHPNLAGYHVIADETAKWLVRHWRSQQPGASAPKQP